ncbi:MAG: alpha/beta hydrolase [Gemmatimonadota bacterium]|nr:alpha/beta hydrolase [Gemmatimonadota bacterium]
MSSKIRSAGLTLVLSLWTLTACTSSSPQTGRTESGIYFEVSGEGAPVVLVHGFSLDRRMWDREESLLRSGYRVVRYDLRGHGLSDPWSEPFAAEDDMLDVFDAAGLRQATIIGLSAGAQVALDFALAHPDRVAALVLASPGVGGYQAVGSFDWMGPVMTELQAGEPQQAMRAWTETPLMKIATDPSADSAMRSIVMDNWVVWTYDPQLQAMPDPPAITRLSDITAPTLILIGQNDLIDTKRVGDTLAACIVNVQLVTMATAGHLVNLEAPERFAQTITNFLDRGPPPRTVPRPGC